MFLFFDTETTGLPLDWRAGLDDLDNWPRLVQLAWLLVDAQGVEQDGKNTIIRPEGFEIPSAAARVHGITTSRALEEGNRLDLVLNEFARAIERAQIMVAHNMSFDEKIMGAEFLRKKIKHQLFAKPQICTMHSSTNFCQIQNGHGYKWPKLMELHEKLFHTGFDGAHDALADVRACSRCFFELVERGVIGS